MTAIQDEINKQCNNLPRGNMASKALSHRFIVYARDMVEVLGAAVLCRSSRSHAREQYKVDRLHASWRKGLMIFGPSRILILFHYEGIYQGASCSLNSLN